MSTYVLIILLITNNSSFFGSIDFENKKLCDEAGNEFLSTVKDVALQAKYLCIERK